MAEKVKIHSRTAADVYHILKDFVGQEHAVHGSELVRIAKAKYPKDFSAGYGLMKLRDDIRLLRDKEIGGATIMSSPSHGYWMERNGDGNGARLQLLLHWRREGETLATLGVPQKTLEYAVGDIFRKRAEELPTVRAIGGEDEGQD